MVTRFQQEGLSASRCRQVVMVLSQVLDSAIADGIIRANPCGAVRLPRLPKTEMEVLSAAKVERLAASIDPRHRSLVHVLAYGGLRWGEAVALTRSTVDLQRGRLDVSDPSSRPVGICMSARRRPTSSGRWSCPRSSEPTSRSTCDTTSRAARRRAVPGPPADTSVTATSWPGIGDPRSKRRDSTPLAST
jgi:hypothetical protein